MATGLNHEIILSHLSNKWKLVVPSSAEHFSSSQHARARQNTKDVHLTNRKVLPQELTPQLASAQVARLPGLIQEDAQLARGVREIERRLDAKREQAAAGVRNRAGGTPAA